MQSVWPLFVLLIGFLFVAALTFCTFAIDRRPNFVVIFADDVSCSDFGTYGHPHIRTPHIDCLAAEGIRFDAAFLTCSSCSPSRSSILTGRYPHNTGAAELHMPLPADQVVLAGLLKQHGYYTASAGKWHLGKAAEKHFDLIVGGLPSGCEHWVEVLSGRPQEKPFFLWLAAFDAHRTYEPNTVDPPHDPGDTVVPPFLPDVPETREDLALYYDEVSRLDHYVGQVLGALREAGIADNTFVLFMADNGRPFPRCKTTLYDSGIHTPLVVRYPKVVTAGSICDNLVSSIDIAPTILQLAGVEVPSSMQGRSFTPLLSDPTATLRDYVFAEHNWHDYQCHERSVRDQRYLYIRNSLPHLPATPPADAVMSPTYAAMRQLFSAGKLTPPQQSCFLSPRVAEELYDVQEDPHCLTNLASAADGAATLERMRAAVDDWIERTNDRFPESPTPDRFDRSTGERLKSD